MKFIIPSYQRYIILLNKTYDYLIKQNISTDDIYIICREDDDQLDNYKRIKSNIIITDVKGIGATHNFISSYFDEGDYIVEIDDDMSNLIDNERKDISDFKELCQTMKDKMIEEGCSYGGTYAVDNSMFMSGCKQYTTDLRYMLGCLRFRFIRKEIAVVTDYAEDFEHCILHYLRDGKILKNNWIAPITKNYNAGGCDGDGRNFESEKKDKEYLANKYPQYCRLFERKNGRWDCRIRHYKSNKKLAI